MSSSQKQWIAIILIVAGIAMLVYQGFTYTKREEVARIGDVQVTADTQKTVYFSPIYGVVSLSAGILLLVLVKRNKD